MKSQELTTGWFKSCISDHKYRSVVMVFFCELERINHQLVTFSNTVKYQPSSSPTNKCIQTLSFLTSCTFLLVFSNCWDCGSSYQECWLSGRIWDALLGLSASSPALAGAGLGDSPWGLEADSLRLSPLWPVEYKNHLLLLILYYLLQGLES